MGGAFADGGDNVRRNYCGDQAEFHFRQGKHGVLRADRHVTAGHQSHAATIRSTLHAGNRRFGKSMQRGHQCAQRFRIAKVFFIGIARNTFHPAEIAAGGK